MRKNPSAIPAAAAAAFVFLALLMGNGCNSSKAGPAVSKGGRPEAKPALSTTPDSAVVAYHCSPGPSPVALTAMKDSAGNIGGYVFRRLILDSPVYYLDPQGKEVAMFHIFGSPEEKKLNAPKIDALRASYPVQEDIKCPETAGP